MAVAQLVVNKVDRPNVVGIARPQPDHRGVVVIETFAFLMSVRQLKPFLAPQPFDLLMVHTPTFGTEQFVNLAIAVPAILFGQPDQGQAQFNIVL